MPNTKTDHVRQACATTLFAIALAAVGAVTGPFAHAQLMAPGDAVSISAGAAPQPAKPPLSPGRIAATHGVRALAFQPQDPAFFFRDDGHTNVTVFKTSKTLSESLAPAEAKTLAALVDFQKEEAVLVRWTTSGPPDGILTFRFEGVGAQRRVVFFVQDPPAHQIRGQRFVRAVSFFAIPKGMPVTFDPQSRR